MHAHIVLAHPEPQSFNGHLVNVAKEALQGEGWGVTVSDLYGIGSQAMDFLNNTCQELGVATIQLEVKNDNPEAAVLYEKAGFEKLDRAFMLATL